MVSNEKVDKVNKFGDILREKENNVAMGKKGRLVRKRPRTKSTPEQTRSRMLVSAIEKTSQEVIDNFVAEWKTLKSTGSRKNQAMENWIILSLLKLGLSYGEVQSVLRCGRGRICKINNPDAYKRNFPPSKSH